MRLHELKPAPFSKKAPKRVGRGTGSGLGRNSGKGEKGQKSRAGGSTRLGFEGGQMPLVRRIPKRGFTNIFAKRYTVLNIDRLNIFNDDEIVTEELLLQRRVISKVNDGVKLLGSGDIEKKLTVKVTKLSKSAAEKIEAAGGKVEVL